MCEHGNVQSSQTHVMNGRGDALPQRALSDREVLLRLRQQLLRLLLRLRLRRKA